MHIYLFIQVMGDIIHYLVHKVCVPVCISNYEKWESGLLLDNDRDNNKAGVFCTIVLFTFCTHYDANFFSFNYVFKHFLVFKALSEVTIVAKEIDAKNHCHIMS